MRRSAKAAARRRRARTHAAGRTGYPGYPTHPGTAGHPGPGGGARRHPVEAARQGWHTQPLRTRLALITTALLTLGLLTASLSVTSLLYNQLLGQVDDQLQATAQAIGTQGLSQIRAGDSTTMPSTYFVEAQYLTGESGQMISDRTASAYGVPTIGTLSLKDAISHASDPELTTVESTMVASPWRVITLPITDGVTKEYLGVVAIALPLSDVRETVDRTRLVVTLTDVAVILGGALAATYLVRRSFRSLRQIEGVAGRIASGDLSARVPVSEPPTTEVGSLQLALNTMLQQNEQAFDVQVVTQERMTRFVSDASHELRTPLSAIRGYGELYRMGGVPPDRVTEVMGRIESEASRMGRLVDDLLQLARMDEGRQMARDTVNVTALAAGALADMLVLDPDRDCALLPLDDVAAADPDHEPPLVLVLGDRDRLAQVLTNLLGNVIGHTPVGSPVEIAIGVVPDAAGPGAPTSSDSAPAGPTPGHLAPGDPVPGHLAPGDLPSAGPVPDVTSAAQAADDAASPAREPGARSGFGTAVIEVRDHGPGVPAADQEKVFQRFYRSDSSRNRSTGGSGLGLSIVAAIIGRHGGRVRMLPTPGGGATVRIELPALPVPAAGTPSPTARPGTAQPGEPGSPAPY